MAAHGEVRWPRVGRFDGRLRGDFHGRRHGVEPICRTLGASASAYYERRTGRRSARAIEDVRLLARIKEVHERNYCAYGYRRMWIALRREGEEVGRGRVQRLMRQAGIQGAKRRGKPWRTTKPDPNALRRPDLVERDFAAPAPGRLWVGDFTYLRSWEGVSYFAFVIDAFSRKVVLFPRVDIHPDGEWWEVRERRLQNRSGHPTARFMLDRREAIRAYIAAGANLAAASITLQIAILALGPEAAAHPEGGDDPDLGADRHLLLDRSTTLAEKATQMIESGLEMQRELSIYLEVTEERPTGGRNPSDPSSFPPLIEDYGMAINDAAIEAEAIALALSSGSPSVVDSEALAGLETTIRFLASEATILLDDDWAVGAPGTSAGPGRVG